MIRQLIKICSLVAMLSMTGCLYTLNAPYLPEDVVFDQQLIGKWSDQNKDSKEKSTQAWTFKKLADKSYEVQMKNDGEPDAYTFEGHLFKLEDTQFLDLFPIKKENEDFEAKLLLPYHLIYKIQIEERKIILRLPDSEWKDALKEGKLSIPRIETNGEYILTSPSKEMRGIFLEYRKIAFKNENDPKLSFKVELYRENQ